MIPAYREGYTISMRTIELNDTDGNLAALVEPALHGEEILLTKAGEAVARVVPHRPDRASEGKANGERGDKLPWTLEQMREFRRGNTLGPGLTIRQMINEGRR